MTRVAILGGGPAGLGAAYRLADSGKAEVVLLERGRGFGGNAGSFDWQGHRLDFGSHRLHPSCDEEVLTDIRGFLSDGLLDRPRHGRIRLLGRWVHFPLKPVDMLLHVRPSFAAKATLDSVKKMLPGRRAGGEESFESVLEESLGPTICRHFYFPYARKIWGLEPRELSPIQARRRVSASSFGKLVKKVLSSVPGLKRKGAGRFFYPTSGFGGISEAYAERARGLGADLRLGCTVEQVERLAEGFRITAVSNGKKETFDADHVWSTIPLTLLLRTLTPAPPDEILAATREIEYRAMVLIYAELPVDRFTEYDAHYFPSEEVRITRLSETKNYAARTTPEGRTVICAELPCQAGDEMFTASEEALGALLVEDLLRSGLPLPAMPTGLTARRLPQAYPIYRTGYEAPFETLDAYARTLPKILSFGRQGLFAHDNTHHALFMAYAAERCLVDGRLDEERWAEYRRLFETHVVED